MFKRLAAAAAIGFAAFLTTGCFDIEQTLTLERNLSGKAGFQMKVDMSPIAVFMAHMAHAMEGKTGEPSAADIDKARKELLSQDKPMDRAEFAKGRKEFEGQLPKGVTLLDATFEDQPLGLNLGFVFGFDHPSKLSQIQFPKEAAPAGGAAPGPTPGGNPIDNPFGGFTIVEQGGTILITSPPQNPVAEKTGPDQPKPSAEDQKLTEQLFKGLRVAFKITAPFAIVEHNAHRKDGNTLVWEYTLKSFETMTDEQLKQSIKVRYKK